MVRRQQAADRAVRPKLRSPGHPKFQRGIEAAFWAEIAKGLLPIEAAAVIVPRPGHSRLHRVGVVDRPRRTRAGHRAHRTGGQVQLSQPPRVEHVPKPAGHMHPRRVLERGTGAHPIRHFRRTVTRERPHRGRRDRHRLRQRRRLHPNRCSTRRQGADAGVGGIGGVQAGAVAGQAGDGAEPGLGAGAVEVAEGRGARR